MFSTTHPVHQSFRGLIISGTTLLASITAPCRAEDNITTITEDLGSGTLPSPDDDYPIQTGDPNLGAYIGGGIGAAVLFLVLVGGVCWEYKQANAGAKVADENSAAASNENVTVDVDVPLPPQGQLPPLNSANAPLPKQSEQQEEIPAAGSALLTTGPLGNRLSISAPVTPNKVTALNVDQQASTPQGAVAPPPQRFQTPPGRPGGYGNNRGPNNGPNRGHNPGPTSGPNQVRGTCANCGKAVLVSQPREQNEDGSYFHTDARQCAK